MIGFIREVIRDPAFWFVVFGCSWAWFVTRTERRMERKWNGKEKP